MATENEPFSQFLSEHLQSKLDMADNNPFIKISLPDKSIPFIVISNCGVVVDVTANNPKTILKDSSLASCGSGV